ncbi:EAL domain-containing protein [Geitlerinema sp. PCC 9228]|jgi:EAL domain-containing protein (putative c-di-GMP-specific phosphodiesterase class I)|uniref:putative bifunctional diguanylate cyclase/phosphodiesterase n=1 Tax=Geitlerinema sp. PCC 9228 TaxID=111611 RepID=UPI0008F9A6C6|nr:EAL domain-containing protein [Geitlerinema sp. PCC 9228]
MLAMSLEHAFKENQFLVCYHPQVSTQTREILGVEALVRWQHPHWGTIPPKDFIPIAEETDWIWPLDRWVLQTACQQVRAWHMEGYPIKLAVNLSAKDFQNPHLVDVIAQILAQTQLDPNYLEIELTETLFLNDFAQALQSMLGLRSLGVRIALDDFGTGYSSLLYLKRFPFNCIKIDRSFIRDLFPVSKNSTIVESVIQLAHQLHLDVIGEGIENERQLQFLRQHHCDLWQGYLFSPPLAALAFTKQFLTSHPELVCSAEAIATSA